MIEYSWKMHRPGESSLPCLRAQSNDPNSVVERIMAGKARCKRTRRFEYQFLARAHRAREHTSGNFVLLFPYTYGNTLAVSVVETTDRSRAFFASVAFPFPLRSMTRRGREDPDVTFISILPTLDVVVNVKNLMHANREMRTRWRKHELRRLRFMSEIETYFRVRSKSQ